MLRIPTLVLMVVDDVIYHSVLLPDDVKLDPAVQLAISQVTYSVPPSSLFKPNPHRLLLFRSSGSKP